jgi:DNA-binding response OmpR family regulator
MASRVLVIVNSSAIRQQLRFILNSGGFVMEESNDCWSALRLLSKDCYSLIIADEDAPLEERECILRHLRTACNRSPVPLLLLSRDERLNDPLRECTVRLLKPFSAAALLATLRKIGVAQDGAC